MQTTYTQGDNNQGGEDESEMIRNAQGKGQLADT